MPGSRPFDLYDPDRDGLDNQQEIIWGADPFNPDTDGDGYKDGEEVKSGHNPLVPGPDDLISADNLTLELSNLAVAGLAEGSLQADSPNYEKALADITSAIGDSVKYSFNKEISDSEITVVDSNDQTISEYFSTIAPYTQTFGRLINDQLINIPEHMNAIGKNGFGDPKLKSYFSNQAAQYQEIVQKGARIKVPKSLSGANLEFLSLALQMHDVSEAIARGEDDPLKAAFALNAFGDIYDQYLELFEKYETALIAESFDPAKVSLPNQ